jgi:hypothetical protein
MNPENFNLFLAGLSLPQYLAVDTTHQDVTRIATGSEFYRDVFEKNAAGQIVLSENTDLPVLSRSYRLYGNNSGAGEDLILLRDGRPMLTLNRSGKGSVYQLSVPLSDSWSNFQRHSLFLPTLFQIAFLSNPGSELFYHTGQKEIMLRGDSVSEKALFKIRNNKTGLEFIPGIENKFSLVTLRIDDQISEAGLYTLMSGEKAVLGLAFNYDRRESDTRCLGEKDLKKGIGRFITGNIHLLTGKKYSVSDQIKKINEGTPLWKWFLLIALLFIAIEILLIRLFRD